MNSDEKTRDGHHPSDTSRLILAGLIPLAAFVLQWIFWEAIQPYVWFLFYPAVFFSSWIGGKRAGLAATALSTVVVWWFFMPYRYSFALERPTSAFSIVIFAGMGVLFSLTHERLCKANRLASEVLATVSVAKDHLEERVNERTAELTRTLADLRSSEEKYRLIAENAEDWIYWITPDGKLPFLSPSFERMTGYSVAEFASNPQLLTDLVHPEDRLQVLHHTEKVQEEYKADYLEFRVITKTGEILWVSHTCGPIYTLEGQYAGRGVANRNITERKQAEEALRHSEERYRAMFNTLIEGFCIIEVLFDADDRPTDYRFLEINPAFELQTGLQNAQGKLMRELAPEHEAYWFEIYGKVALTGESVHFVNEAKALNRWYDVTAYRIGGQGSRNVAILFNDITEAKLAEKALRESEARLRLSVTASNIGLWDWDLVTNEVYFSPEWKGQLGYAEDEIPNRFEEWQSRIHPDDLTLTQARVQSFIEDPDAKYAIEFRLRHKDGSYRWIFTQGQLFRDTAGKPTRMMGCHIDITEQKKLEMQYLHAQKMESIGTLAGGVAHDFNNILSAIMGYGQILTMKMAKENSHRQYVDQILVAADRAAHLTRELLLFSRKQESVRRPVDLNDVIGTMEKFLRRIIGDDIVMKQVTHGESLPVLADGHQLEQVLMNLAVNAHDAMLHGGEFTLETERFDMQEDFIAMHGYGEPGDYALLTVSDTGTGMDRETLQRIFEPFFTTKEVGKGTGLGLSVVYGIIKQHNGFITVYSEPGQGSIFRIYLPLSASATQQEVHPQQEEAIVRGSEIILLAEDDLMVRTLMTNVLKEAGYTVIEAVDGVNAVRRFKENSAKVDLLMLDLMMPVMNGKDAFEEIRKLRPEIKVIFSSGYAPETIQQKLDLAEGVIMIAKPVSPSDMLRKIRNVLDGTS